MGKKYTFEKAVSLAGILYGNILGRAADKAGFDAIVEELNSGSESVRNIVQKLMTSEEFREKFLMNNTPNELSKQLRLYLFKELRPKPEAIKEIAIALLEDDWRNVIQNMIASDAYSKAFGEEKIPLIKY